MLGRQFDTREKVALCNIQWSTLDTISVLQKGKKTKKKKTNKDMSKK